MQNLTYLHPIYNIRYSKLTSDYVFVKEEKDDRHKLRMEKIKKKEKTKPDPNQTRQCLFI